MARPDINMTLLGGTAPSGLNYSFFDDRVPGLINGSGFFNTTGDYALSTVPSCEINDTNCNITGNITSPNNFNPLPLWQIIFLGSLASFTSLMTIFGNTVVIMSFVLERQIRQPTNYFIASLAVSDLLIGSISMPFYTVYLLAGQYWPLGELLCDMWLSTDYTLCMTSIYTVFCITIDRFCSVKIPAKYRNWRTDRKVLIIILLTWIIPILVFFTSIFGWQYFVGERTVPEGKCYVQYMEEALFNCILQVGYFWITLIIMCVLYTGIFRVALTLQAKSDAKHKKMTSLVSMAGQTMTKIGIGMSQQQKSMDAARFFPENGNKLGPPSKLTTQTSSSADVCTKQGTSSTSFSSSRNNDKEEDRSSSPTFPSDTEPSSNSPKRSPKTKKNKKMKKNSTCAAALVVPKLAPPKNEKRIYKVERHLPNAIASNGSHCLSSLTNIPLPKKHPSDQEAPSAPPAPPAPPGANGSFQGENDAHNDSGSDAEKEALLCGDPKCRGEEKCEEDEEEAQDASNELLLSKEDDDLPHDKSHSTPDSPIWKRRDSYVNGDPKSDDGSSVGSLNSLPDTPIDTVPTPVVVSPAVNIQVTATTDSKCVQSVLARVEDAAPLNGSDIEPAKKSRGIHGFLPYIRSLRRNKKVRKATKQSKSENRALKALRTITIILGAFVLCWTPWHILSMIISFCTAPEGCVEPVLYDISYYLCYLNSPINPLCYAFANQQFKKTFIRILKLDWHRT